MLPTSCLCSIDWIGCGVVLLRPALCCSIPHPNPIQQPGGSTTTHRRSCCRPGHPPTGRRVHAPCAHRTALHHLPVPQRSFSESPAKTSQHWRRRFFQAGASTTTARFLRGCFQRLVWSNQRHTRWHKPLAHDFHAYTAYTNDALAPTHDARRVGNERRQCRMRGSTQAFELD